MSGYPTGIVAGAGVSKESVNYRHHEQCSTCTYFYPMNSCKKVAGNISPENVCDLYELTEDKDKHRPGKAYFEKAYKESKGS